MYGTSLFPCNVLRTVISILTYQVSIDIILKWTNFPFDFWIGMARGYWMLGIMSLCRWSRM